MLDSFSQHLYSTITSHREDAKASSPWVGARGRGRGGWLRGRHGEHRHQWRQGGRLLPVGLLLLAGGAGKCSFGTGSGGNGAGMVGSTGGEARRPAKGWNRARRRRPAALGRSRAEEMSRERGERAPGLSRVNCFFLLGGGIPL